MSDATKARLDVIDDILGFDESVTLDVHALLFDPGGGLKKREAEGYLVLTNRRLLFGTAKHGLLIDLPIKEVKGPATITHKFTMVRLVIETATGSEHTFVISKSAAQAVALTIGKTGSR